MFAAQASQATLAGLIATVAFAVAYARCSIRLPWYASVAAGWTAYAVTAFALYGLRPALVPSLVSLVAATVLGRRALPVAWWPTAEPVAQPGATSPSVSSPPPRWFSY